VRRGDPTALGEPGTILGILASIRTTTVEQSLEAGDTLLFYTDGMTDVRPPHALTADDIASMAAEASRADSAEGVVDEMHHRLSAALPMSERSDDIALVVVRIVGS
jgi:serine phosphatase RsbU (regulator of sigma subunit)